MSDHEKRRFKDSPIGQLIDLWPAVVGVVSVIYTLARGSTILGILAEASAKSAQFQEAQNGINVKLQTLIDTDENRIHDLEDWRHGMDYWNRRRPSRNAGSADQN